MNLVVNSSTCVVGGGVQVAVGFIRHVVASARARSWQLLILASPAVAAQCAADVCEAGFNIKVFEHSPGAILAGAVIRRQLLSEVLAFHADMVFTVFGPSYVSFPVPEFMGFADGFAITPMAGCYANHPWRSLPVAWLKANAKRLFFRSVRQFWVETEIAKTGLCRRAWIKPERVSVVSNGVNGAFAAALRGASPAKSGDILLIGAGYPHKNHALVLPVARALERLLLPTPWQFVLTLPVDSPSWTCLRDAMASAGLPHRLVNLGVLNLAECAAAYEAASVVFHPSLLEIFSATYVEAMAARRPLVVSDRPFAREICGDAALYFDPLDAQSAAEAIARVLTDSGVRERLVSAGIERLKSFPDAAEKNGRLCDLIDAFAARHVKPAKEARSCQ